MMIPTFAFHMIPARIDKCTLENARLSRIRQGAQTIRYILTSIKMPNEQQRQQKQQQHRCVAASRMPMYRNRFTRRTTTYAYTRT